MTRTVRVVLQWSAWVPIERIRPNGTFIKPVGFDHQGSEWLKGSWSLVLKAEGVPDAAREQAATATFLFETAPQEWLSVGARFTVYEGIRALAQGLVAAIVNE